MRFPFDMNEGISCVQKLDVDIRLEGAKFYFLSALKNEDR